MQMMELGKSGINVSKIALGTITWGGVVKEPSYYKELLDSCLEQGINYVDTAPVYGPAISEELVGKAMTGLRERFVLQTKCGLNWRDTAGRFEYHRNGKDVYRNLSPDAIRQDLEDSLRRLQTDYIDVYVTHRQSLTVSREETVRELLRLKDEGKIRAIGVSNATAKEVHEYQQFTDVAVIQQKYSVVVPRFGNILFPVCDKYGITYQTWGLFEAGALVSRAAVDDIKTPDDPRSRNSVLLNYAMKPYAHSLCDVLEEVAGKHDCSVANVVLLYTARMFDNMNLLVGSSKVRTIEDTCRAFDVTLEDVDIEAVGAAVKRFLDNVSPEFGRTFPVNEEQ